MDSTKQLPPPPSIAAEDRSVWRKWLTENHTAEKSVWLRIFRKNSKTPSVSHDEALDEALCFGWIDSSIRKGSDQYHLQLFAKRNPKSNWSRVNKEKIKKLTKEGIMTEAGQSMVDLAKQTGTWTALDEVEKLTVPPDLGKQLAANPTADSHFTAFPPSVKRGILEWLFNAKTEKTRTKRIEKIVTLAGQNERANYPSRKK